MKTIESPAVFTLQRDVKTPLVQKIECCKGSTNSIFDNWEMTMKLKDLTPGLRHAMTMAKAKWPNAELTWYRGKDAFSATQKQQFRNRLNAIKAKIEELNRFQDESGAVIAQLDALALNVSEGRFNQACRLASRARRFLDNRATIQELENERKKLRGYLTRYRYTIGVINVVAGVPFNSVKAQGDTSDELIEYMEKRS